MTVPTAKLLLLLPVLLAGADPASPVDPVPASDATTALAVRDEIDTRHPDGIWPSSKLLDSLLTRFADRATEEYELDDEARAQVRKAVVDRWGRFLVEHRAAIQPVLNEFLELRLDVEPPTREAVQAWAKRAMPVFERFRDEIAVGTDDIRGVLDPKQRARFEKNVLELGVGLGLAEGSLRQWGRGELDPTEFWQAPRSQRRRRPKAVVGNEASQRQAAAVAVTEVESVAGDQVAVEMDAWGRFVARFILDHQLDGGQQTSAMSLLGELTQRANAHADLHRTAIAALEAAIRRRSKSEAEMAEVEQKLLRLYGPIDEMFGELERRLKALLTIKQRTGAKPSTDTGTAVPNRPQEVPAAPTPSSKSAID